MRKTLLGTTAVVGAALIAATGAQAQTAPEVRVGGYFDFAFGSFSDTQDRGRGAGGRRAQQWDARSDARVVVNVAAKAANGVSYGAYIDLDIGQPDTSTLTDEMWVFISSPTLGTVRLGDEDVAASLLQVRPPVPFGFNQAGTFWATRGGNLGQVRDGFRTHTGGFDDTKIVYLSPSFFGFDFGVSYAPTPTERNFRGGTGLRSRELLGNQNQWSGAVRYRGSFNNVGIAANTGFVRADGPAGAPNLRDPTSYNVGASVNFAGLTLGGEYVWGNYRGRDPGRPAVAAMFLPRGNEASNHWLLGASYSFAPFTVAASYGRGNQDFREFAIPGVPGANGRNYRMTTTAIGVQYALAPGLSLYGLYQNQSERNNPFVNATEGGRRTMNHYIVGTRFTF